MPSALQPCSLLGRDNSWKVKRTRVWVLFTQGKTGIFPSPRWTKASGNTRGELKVAVG